MHLLCFCTLDQGLDAENKGTRTLIGFTFEGEQLLEDRASEVTQTENVPDNRLYFCKVSICLRYMLELGCEHLIHL
jgi:hypothetical protein